MNALDEAQMKHEMREMYKAVGYIESLQCLYEILMSAAILAEVLDEEKAKQ